MQGFDLRVSSFDKFVNVVDVLGMESLVGENRFQMVQNGSDVLDLRVDLEDKVGLGKILEKNFFIWCIIVVLPGKAVSESS